MAPEQSHGPLLKATVTGAVVGPPPCRTPQDPDPWAAPQVPSQPQPEALGSREDRHTPHRPDVYTRTHHRASTDHTYCIPPQTHPIWPGPARGMGHRARVCLRGHRVRLGWVLHPLVLLSYGGPRCTVGSPGQ